MNILKVSSLLTFLLISLFFPNSFAQNSNNLDHKIFIEKIRTSENVLYKDFLKKYDDYLKSHPNDYKIYIEKIEFVENAQYNEIEEYNPNQEYLDSLKEETFRRFYDIPDIQIFKISKIWGEQKKNYLNEIRLEIEAGKSSLNDEQVAKVYFELASEDYNENKFKEAKAHINNAILYDKSFSYSQIYAKILIELNENDYAVEVLKNPKDTTKNAYYLSQKAGLFLILKAYDKAIELYKSVEKIDSSYINRLELAHALEGAGLYDDARVFLLKDTSKVWGKEDSYFQLFIHDLKYGKGADALASYNLFRDFGYEYDKMAFYRIRLFFKNPLLLWRFRDLLGLLTLGFVLIIIIASPSVFILPVYVLWQRNLSSPEPLHSKFNWGLKSLWISMILFGLTIIFSSLFDIKLLDANLDFLGTPKEFTNEILALNSLLFTCFMFIFSLGFLHKSKLSIFFPKNISIIKAIGLGVGYFFIFKIFSSIYLLIAKHLFEINTSELAIIKYSILSVKDQVKSEIIVYGIGVAILTTSIIVPLYEELIFRGIMLGAFSKRINFNLSNFIQASLFSIFHQDLYLVPVFLLFGILAGTLVKKSQSILPNVIFHILNNLFATLLIYREV